MRIIDVNRNDFQRFRNNLKRFTRYYVGWKCKPGLESKVYEFTLAQNLRSKVFPIRLQGRIQEKNHYFSNCSK